MDDTTAVPLIVYSASRDPVEALLGYPIARWYASNGQQGKEPGGGSKD